MKGLLPTLLLLLTAWIGFWAYLNRRCCQSVPAAISYATKFLVHEGETTISESDANFIYEYGSAEITVPSSLEKSLLTLVYHLKQKPSQLLILTGFTSFEEQANSQNKNLGLLRANQIRELFLDLKIPSHQIAVEERVVDTLKVLEGYLWDAVDFSFQNFPLAIADSARFQLSIDDNLRFSFSDHQPSISPTVKESLMQLVTYLNENEQRALVLTGYYSGMEENNTIFNSLGLARASEVKNTLQEFGASEQQIYIKGMKNTEIDVFDVAVIGGVVFEFENNQN